MTVLIQLGTSAQARRAGSSLLSRPTPDAVRVVLGDIERVDAAVPPAYEVSVPDGGAEGTVPVRSDGWLVTERPISGPGNPTPIATIVLARRIDAGL